MYPPVLAGVRFRRRWDHRWRCGLRVYAPSRSILQNGLQPVIKRTSVPRLRVPDYLGLLEIDIEGEHTKPNLVAVTDHTRLIWDQTLPIEVCSINAAKID